MLALADAKASMLLSVLVAVALALPMICAPRLLSQPPFGGQPIRLEPIGGYLVAAVLTTALLAKAAIELRGVLHPQTTPVEPLDLNPLFFGTAMRMSRADFSAALMVAGHDEVAEQCFQTARIVDAKFRRARIGFHYTTAAVAGVVLTLALALTP